MAIGSRNAVFTFKADISNYVQNGAVLVRTNNGIRKSAQDVSTTMMQQKQSMQQTSQTAASAAVNFQTMTQGMLNLSTAGAQTFTSLSNLDRAANRLMMARVAQQRGVDLLRNKELRLAQLREKGGADMRKIAALEAEVATARQDLLVKTDKLRIEEGALNDIRILFATNIANVMISSLQTINTLRQLEVKNTLMASGAKVKDIFVSRMWVQTSKAAITTNKTMALSLRGVLTTLGPIGLAITGISVAMQAYNENWLGFKDALQSVFPFLRDLENDVLPGVKAETDALIDSTNELIGVNQQMSDTFKFDVPTSLGQAMVQLHTYRGELEKLRDVQKEVNQTKVTFTTEGPFIGPNLKPPSQASPSKKGFFGFMFRFPELLPSAYASEFTGDFTNQPFVRFDSRLDKLEAAVAFLNEFVYNPDFRTSSLRQTANAKSFKYHSAETDLEAQINKYHDPASPVYQDIIAAQAANISIQELKIRREYGGLADYIAGGSSAQNFSYPILLKGRIVNGTPIGNVLTQRLRMAEDRDPFSPRRKPFEGVGMVQFMANRGLLGQTIRLPTKVARLIQEGKDDNRTRVAFEFGIDIGAFANVVPEKEAMRIAKLESDLAFVSGGQRGLTTAADILSRSQRTFNRIKVTNAFAGAAGFGSGFFKSSGATAAFQVAKGSINVQWRQAQIAIEDRNRNRLKTGGRRLLNPDGTPMYELWDSRAVEGGFNSIRDYRNDWWINFRREAKGAQTFSEMLGREATKGAGAGYGVATRNIGFMNETRSLLGRTGLSLSALPSRGDFMPKRAGGGIGNVGNRYFSIMASIGRRHSEAVSRTIAANQLTLKRAGQIDLLIGGFGLNEYYGSGLALQQLQLAVQKQDELMQSIGLNRTEAFRIIDTQGRGRNEIDDRVRWTQRNESISTGNIVL